MKQYFLSVTVYESNVLCNEYDFLITKSTEKRIKFWPHIYKFKFQGHFQFHNLVSDYRPVQFLCSSKYEQNFPTLLSIIVIRNLKSAMTNTKI